MTAAPLVARLLALAMVVAACGSSGPAASPSVQAPGGSTAATSGASSRTSPTARGATASASAATTSPAASTTPGRAATATAAPTGDPGGPGDPGTSGPPPGAFDPSTLELALEPVASDLLSPLFLTHAADGSGLRYVLEQGGRIRVLEPDGSVREEPFLDISDRVSSGGERGLLGLAFHPDFGTNGRLFVNYTDRDGDTVIAEFRRPAGAATADAGSERAVLGIDQPYPNHNGGMIAFGPDGYLYIAMGDGGGAGDPQGNGQDMGSLLGKILRIDVSGEEPYAVPRDNPFAGDAGAKPEIWDAGMRNPWRMSFDRETGDLWIGDVGQNAVEEIDAEPAGRGGRNYGWNITEGSRCFRRSECDQEGLTLPVTEYAREDGCTVVGGYVYRGSAHPVLRGAYLFADYCTGRIWGLSAEQAMTERQAPHALLLESGLTIASFGEDEAGELYVVDLDGSVHRVTATAR